MFNRWAHTLFGLNWEFSGNRGPGYWNISFVILIPCFHKKIIKSDACLQKMQLAQK